MDYFMWHYGFRKCILTAVKPNDRRDMTLTFLIKAMNSYSCSVNNSGDRV